MSVFTKVLKAGEGKKVRRLAELVKGPNLAPSERGRAAYTRTSRPAPKTPRPVQESLFENCSEMTSPARRSGR